MTLHNYTDPACTQSCQPGKARLLLTNPAKPISFIHKVLGGHVSQNAQRKALQRSP